jgi:uncharacterized membrane protein
MMSKPSGQTYLKKVRSYLPCSGKVKKQIMEQITESVEVYLAEEPQAGYDQITARFGAPQAIAAAYVENAGTAEILRALQIRRRIVSIVAAVMAAILLSWAGAVTWAMIQYKHNSQGFVTVSIQEGEVRPADDPYWSTPEGQFFDETGG